MARGTDQPGDDSARLSDRAVAGWMVAVGGAAFVALAAWLVPWEPVPGGLPDPVRASSVFSASQIERAEDYSRTARIISYSSLGVSLLVACLLGFTSWGSRLLGSRRRPWALTVVGLVAAVLLIGEIVTLPLALWRRNHLIDNGLSNQGIGPWFVDQALGFAVSFVFTSIGLLVLVGSARRWRTWWPAIAAGLAAALVVLGSFVYPMLVEPLFNDFESLEDGSLRDRILALADEEGVPVDDVLVSDASRRTTTLNAYVSGFGSTRRVVVYDNLVKSLSEDQALSVVAHELAHTKHHDVAIGTALGASGTVFGVGLLALLLGSSPVRRRAAVDGASDPRVVAVVLALIAIGSLASAPAGNAISRRIETRADVTALEVTEDPRAFIAMQKKLSVRSLSDPTPPTASQFWFGSHPTLLQRVSLARLDDGDR